MKVFRMLISFVERLNIIDADLVPVCHAAGNVRDARAQHKVCSSCLVRLGVDDAHAAV